MIRLLFYVSVAFISAHELDAIRQQEWRALPIMCSLGDAAGYHLFVLLHVPLWIAIFWLIDTPAFQIGFDIFLVLHAAAHHLLRRHPLLTFDGALSHLLVYGAAAFGALHLFLAT